MEMPIAIIITLFLGITVGGLAIFFTQNMLLNAQDQIIKFTEKGEGALGALVEVKDITEGQVASLASSCNTLSLGKALNDQVCYIIHGETPKSLNSAEVIAKAGVNTTVTADSSKFFLIRWKSNDNLVEVTT